MSPRQTGQNQQQTSRFVANAAAVAFGGEIREMAEIERRGSWNDRAPLDPPFTLEGVSCALPVSGGRTVTHRQDVASIDDKGNRFASFKDALSETKTVPGKDAVETSSLCEVVDLEVGLVAPVRFPRLASKITGTYQLRDETQGEVAERVLARAVATAQGKRSPEQTPEKASFELVVDEELPLIAGGVQQIVNIRQDVPATYRTLATAVDEKQFQPLPESPYQSGMSHDLGLPIIISLAEPYSWRSDEIGTLYFAELIAKPEERNFTLVRFQLGSPAGGSASASFVSSNGGKQP